ncbi:MAG TPA: hypothetical protein VH877_27745 [Polyangia bacterium]|jgi:hypothetical protein|nr:hypothetical protein [Polyangia bacterium]
MSGFVTASNAFREYAIKKLGSKDVASGPNSEAIKMPHTIGGAWAFNAALAADPKRLVRGWALADGTVITTEQNFGRLLAEAGLWASPPSDLGKLSMAVAWSLGQGYVAFGAPAVKLGPDGAGEITFEVTFQEGGGGGYVSPQSKYDAVVTVAKDRSATVRLVKK